ncbi:MAG TPA: hypothetical protein VM492_01515, partial [Sumerlaeia bacterium]|nr:hypothetical protein [Sumerlaeia bacterium]
MSKRLSRWALLAILTGAALVAVLLFTPFSSPLLDKQIRKAWREATGLEISFRQAIYFVAWGRLEVKGIRIYNPEDDRDLAAVDQMVIHWRWRLQRPSAPIELQSVRIVQPAPMVLYVDSDLRLAPDPRLQSFLDLFQSLTSAGAPAPRGRFPHVQVADFALYLHQKTQTGDRTLAGIRDVNVDISEDRAAGWILSLTGRIPGETSSPSNVAVTLNSRPDKPGRVLSLEMDSFDLATHFGQPLPVAFSAQEIRLTGATEPSDDPASKTISLSVSGRHVRFGSRATTPTLESDNAQGAGSPGWDLPDTDVRAAARVTLDTKNWEIALSGIEAQALDSHIAGAARFSLAQPNPYVCEITEGAILSQGLTWLQARTPESRQPVRFTQGRLEPRLRFSGDRRGIDRATCQGEVTASDLFAATPWTKTPLGPIRIEARLTSETLHLTQIDVQAPPGRLTVSARIARTEREPGAGLGIQASWTVDLATEKMLASLAEGRLERLKGWGLAGTLLGNGSIRGAVPRDFLRGGPPGRRDLAPQGRPPGPPRTTAREEDAAFRAIVSLLGALEIDGMVR